MEGQVALVTGGTRGIGKSIATSFVKAGINTIITGLNEERAKAALQEINQDTNRCRFIRSDVSKSSDVASLFEIISNEFGRLDILINNAGVTKDNLLLRSKEDDWDTVMDTNLKGTFLCTQEAIKIMSRQKYGRIVNLTSVVAFIGNPGQAIYAASKAGIIGFTRSVALEYAKRGITVNAIAPGFIKTDMTDRIPEKIKTQILEMIPMGTYGTGEDIANAVMFLISPNSSYITGQVIHVNGGMYLG
ncbi:MAG: 3-oxoacyl-[acyl-carrier-protein] reductase [Thermodesulfovibrionales bacterium]|nr:3-oxoacyl-[acyl-carrier-protein] reductase [Thermodesulfovibrionales bacterium]